MTTPHKQSAKVHGLKRELMSVFVLGGSLLLVAASALWITQGGGHAVLWLAPAFVCWLLVVWQCHRRLHLNLRRQDGALFPSLGHGNRVTLLRGLLIAATAGFVVDAALPTQPLLPFVPALLYTLAALGDALDGYLARRQRQTTILGQQLDMSLDALGLLVAPLLAVLYGYLHPSYLLVSMAYYLFQWGLYWRQKHGKPVYDLPPSRVRRYLAGAQMALVAVVLWPVVPTDLSRLAGVIFMVPLLAGFWRDWLHVSGRRGGQSVSSS